MLVPDHINQQLKDFWNALPHDGENMSISYGQFNALRDELLSPLIDAEVAKVVVYEGPYPPYAVLKEMEQVYYKAFRAYDHKGNKADAEIAALIARTRFLNKRMGSMQAKEAEKEEKAEAHDQKAADIAARKADRLALLEAGAAAAIGPRIALERIKRKFSQATLGEAIGVSQVSIYRWEAQRQVVPLDKLKLIAKLFDLPLSYFTGE